MRGSGRTQRMLEILADCIVEGQPHAHVIAANYIQIKDQLMPRLVDLLSSKSMHPKPWNQTILKCDGSIIWFHTLNSMPDCMRGKPGQECCFWDHYAEEKLYTLPEYRMEYRRCEIDNFMIYTDSKLEIICGKVL